MIFSYEFLINLLFPLEVLYGRHFRVDCRLFGSGSSLFHSNIVGNINVLRSGSLEENRVFSIRVFEDSVWFLLHKTVLIILINGHRRFKTN